MPTVREIIVSVREYCGNPGHARLNLGTICLHLYDQIDHLLNRLNLTDENWILGRKIITVGDQNDEYSLPANFGRPMMVETVDDGNSNYVRREIQIVNLQDFNLFWNGYKQSTLYDGYNHTAEVVAVYGLDGQGPKQIKFAPTPPVAASYQIWYEINRQAPPQLDSRPLLMEQFHNLLKVNTALSCLPHCGYIGEQSDTFEQHQGMLAMLKAEFDEVFDRYIHQNHHEDTGPRRSFNSSRTQRGGY